MQKPRDGEGSDTSEENKGGQRLGARRGKRRKERGKRRERGKRHLLKREVGAACSGASWGRSALGLWLLLLRRPVLIADGDVGDAALG